MRPDVAEAFDRMAAAAREGAGLFLSITSAFRSDAEQARLFAAKPTPHLFSVCSAAGNAVKLISWACASGSLSCAPRYSRHRRAGRLSSSLTQRRDA
jgi:D-alanyl-D-alanine carboxypeptidase